MLFKSQQIVILLGVWVLLILALLMLFNAMDLTYYFALAFLGFLIISSLISPYIIKPAWKSRLNYVTIACTLIFSLTLVQKALAIISEVYK